MYTSQNKLVLKAELTRKEQDWWSKGNSLTLMGQRAREVIGVNILILPLLLISATASLS